MASGRLQTRMACGMFNTNMVVRSDLSSLKLHLVEDIRFPWISMSLCQLTMDCFRCSRECGHNTPMSLMFVCTRPCPE